MKKIFALMSILVLALTACTKDEEYKITTVMDDVMPSITVIYSISGPGDNGYNDKIVEGVIQFCDSTNIALHTIRPASVAEAESIVNKWITDTEGRATRSMLILAGNEYSKLASAIKPIEDQNRCILLVESEDENMPKGVVTACVDRKSVMYLAGAMSARTTAYIMAAMPGDKMVEAAIKAFSDGYEAHQQGYSIKEVHYLYGNEQGYAMPNLAYEYADSVNNEHFFFDYELRCILLPMAGGSNTGAYFHSIQWHGGLISNVAVIGMDGDYSGSIEMSPFSIVISVDMMIKDCISTWMKGKSLPAHRTYCMEDGYADIVMNPSFDRESRYAMEMIKEVVEEDMEFTRLESLPADYWTNKYEELKSEALEYGRK